ncbi:MAG: hypothetical protein V3T17_00810 [Pseudomonadales bacterium]
MKKLYKMLIPAIAVPFVAASMLSTAYAVERQTANIEGVAVTGFNRLLGQPLWILDTLGGPAPAGFNFIFGHNPGGEVAFDLNESTPGDTVLATGVDPGMIGFLDAMMNIPPSMSTPHEHMLNIPIHNDFVVVAPFFSETFRMQVPSVMDAPGNSVTRALPNNPVTLDDWLAAEGTLSIRCYSDDSASININMTNLVPNGLYTLWGVYKVGGPFPLGGLPNAITSNDRGKARITRRINFCPMTSTNPLLWTVNITLHSDGNVYGGVPEMPGENLPGGIVDHDHINWPVNVLETL